MLAKVVVPLMPMTEAFELGVACEVFGFDRSDDGLPTYDFSLIAAVPGPIRTRFGYNIDVPYNLDSLDDADLIVVSAGGTYDAGDAYMCSPSPDSSVDRLLVKLNEAVAGAPRWRVCAPERLSSGRLDYWTEGDARRIGGMQRGLPRRIRKPSRSGRVVRGRRSGVHQRRHRGRN